MKSIKLLPISLNSFKQNRTVSIIYVEPQNGSYEMRCILDLPIVLFRGVFWREPNNLAGGFGWVNNWISKNQASWFSTRKILLNTPTSYGLTKSQTKHMNENKMYVVQLTVSENLSHDREQFFHPRQGHAHSMSHFSNRFRWVFSNSFSYDI